MFFVTFVSSGNWKEYIFNKVLLLLYYMHANLNTALTVNKSLFMYEVNRARSNVLIFEVCLTHFSLSNPSEIASITDFGSYLSNKTLTFCFFSQQVDCQLPSVGSAMGSSPLAACGTHLTSGLRIPSKLLTMSQMSQLSHPYYSTQTSSDWLGSS